VLKSMVKLNSVLRIVLLGAPQHINVLLKKMIHDDDDVAHREKQIVHLG